MEGKQFKYDESEGTFYYFLLSFLALILVPGTYYWWPRKSSTDYENTGKECNCEDCKKKNNILKSNRPWEGTRKLLVKLVIVAGWLMIAMVAHKVSQLDFELANFDPYDILDIPLGSSKDVIKKAYRQRSLVFHPDKETGNEKAFMRLTKAYMALTDAKLRRNWDKYGNPDGPGALSFGIALPSWVVKKENSVWVLGTYALVFMITLPTVVGSWWYRSIKYSRTQVLLDTTKLYYYFFNKTPMMGLRRVLMILAASLEFEKKHNSEMAERQTDDNEVQQLVKQLYNLGEKNRERPLCYAYSIKARALLHAHVSRITLSEQTLDKDRRTVVAKCPYLIQEMVTCVSQLVMLAYAGRIETLTSIETIENCMKLSAMLVQALWDDVSPLCQLPHISVQHKLTHFTNGKHQIGSIEDFARLSPEERRTLLHFLSEEHFAEVIGVVARMPLIEMRVRTEVIDDEPSTNITAAAIVTVSVTLVRRDMSTLWKDYDTPSELPLTETSDSQGSSSDEDEETGETQCDPWKRKRLLEERSIFSHSVHCPYYPEDKQEYWWAYVSDRKSRTLLTAPRHVTDLVRQRRFRLHFTAPRWPGLYNLAVCLRSDSYLGFDIVQDFQLDVKEAPQVPILHPQWESLDEDIEENDKQGDVSDLSEFTTDEDVEDDYDPTE